jgi:hypothetical protein
MAEEKKKGGRPFGSLGKKTIQKDLGVDAATLDPPPQHKYKTDWKEPDAVAELEFLIRFLDNMDRTKIFPGQCLSFMGYRRPNLYQELAKKFPDSCGPLLEFARMIQRDKIAMLALTKDYDSRFAVFTLPNISNWRQTQQIDVSTNVSIKTKDYKQTQPIINKRMEDAKKG